MFRRVAFDPIADFTPVTQVSDIPTIIAVNPASGIRTLGRADRAHPRDAGPLELRHAGHRHAEPPRRRHVHQGRPGLELTHVAFRGGAPSLTAILAGDIEIIIGTPPVVLPHARAGRLTALAMTTAAPSPVIPDVPGAAAAGLPGLDIAGWYGLFAPARLPPVIRDRIFAATTAALATPLVRDRFAQEGLQAIASPNPDDYAAFVAREIPFWAKVVQDAGATAE